MENSISFSALVAVKNKTPYITCSQFHMCPMHEGHYKSLFSKRSIERNRRFLKKHVCIATNCIEGNNRIHELVKKYWVEPIDVSGFWDKIKNTGQTLDNNLFLFSPEAIVYTIDPLVEEIMESENKLQSILDDYKNTLFAFFMEDSLRIVVIDEDGAMNVAEFKSDNNIVSFFVCDNEDVKEGLENKIIQSEEIDVEIKNNTRKEECLIIAVLQLLPYIRNEGVRILKGEAISKNPLRTFYNDTPYDIIRY